MTQYGIWFQNDMMLFVVTANDAKEARRIANMNISIKRVGKE